MAIKVYTSVAKGLKAKVRKFWGLINMSVEVTREKLIGCVGVGGGHTMVIRGLTRYKLIKK